MSFDVSQQNELLNFTTKIEKYSYKSYISSKKEFSIISCRYRQEMIPLWQFFLIKLADNIWNIYQLNNLQKSMA